MMNVLSYLEDGQGFLFRLLRQGYGRWPEPRCMMQQDYLCLKIFHVSERTDKEMQHIKETLTDPSLRYLTTSGAKHINVQRLREAHRLIILQALRAGRQVSDEVLEAYPAFRELVVQAFPDGSAQVCLYGEILFLSQEGVSLFYQLSGELDACSTLYRHQTDPYPDPKQLLELKNPGSEIECAWYTFDQHLRGVRSRVKANDVLSQVLTRLIDNEIYHLTVWFQQHGYDEVHIPPPPAIDHNTSRDRPEGWFLKRPAIVFGQIGCCGIEHPEVGGVSVFLDNPGYTMAQWHAAYLWPRSSRWSLEKTEAVWTIAREISMMTNWSVVFEQSRKVRRTILAKLRSLVEQHQGQLEDDFVKRFQVN